jgi:hypothetical protein
MKPKLNVTRVGVNALEVYDNYSAAQVNLEIDARIRRTGESRHDGNIRQWYTDREDLDAAGQNIWARGGMRAKHTRYRVTIDTATGERTEERIGIVYKNPI